MLALASARLEHEIEPPLGHLSFHSRSMFTTGAGRGIVRSPGLRVRLANLQVTIGALPDVQFAL